MLEIDRRAFIQTGASALLSLGLVRPAVQPSGRPTLVCLFLRGGVDGLSMIVPHADPLYYRARPHTAIPASSVIDLNGYFGLHPGLAALKPFWDDGRLTLVPAAGFPEIERSHVEAQDRIDALLARSGAVTCKTLAHVACLIDGGQPPSIAVVNIGGWDTHVNQGAAAGRLATRLQQLGRDIAAFAGRRCNVTVVAISEFGRAIHENRNGGTDHGHATTMLALGALPGARAGVWGSWPGLGATNVAVTTDVRALFS
jgi:uncharacterized protein (DUF1501 family)